MTKKTTSRIAKATVGILAVLLMSSLAVAGVGVSFTVSGGSQTIDTSDGTITVSGDGSGTLQAVEGPWTNVTGISMGAQGLDLNPADKQQVNITGGIESINFTSVVVNDNETDIRYNTSAGGGTIALHGQSVGANLSIVNASGVEVDESQVASDGSVTWTVGGLNQSLRVQAPLPSDLAPINVNATDPDTKNWTNGSSNATLDTVGSYVSRVPGVAIGGTGTGSAAPLLLGILVVAGLTAAPSAVSAGPVAGAVVGVSAIIGVVAVGLAPQWLYAIVLFALGAVATAVVIRLWQ